MVTIQPRVLSSSRKLTNMSISAYFQLFLHFSSHFVKTPSSFMVIQSKPVKSIFLSFALVYILLVGTVTIAVTVRLNEVSQTVSVEYSGA